MPHVPGHGPNFAPELDEAFIEKLQRPVRRRGARDVGLARGEALRRGLSGDAFEGAAVSGARARTGERLADIEADVGFRRAGLQRQERLIGEGRRFGVSEREARQRFSAGEAEKERQSRLRLQNLGFQQRRQLLDESQEDPFLQFVTGVGAQGLGTFIGSGGLGKKT